MGRHALPPTASERIQRTAATLAFDGRLHRFMTSEMLDVVASSLEALVALGYFSETHAD